MACCLSLYHNCDSATIRLRHDYDEKLTCYFFLASNGSRRARYVVVVSQSNRNCNHGFRPTFLSLRLQHTAFCLILMRLSFAERSVNYKPAPLKTHQNKSKQNSKKSTAVQQADQQNLMAKGKPVKQTATATPP